MSLKIRRNNPKKETFNALKNDLENWGVRQLN